MLSLRPELKGAIDEEYEHFQMNQPSKEFAYGMASAAEILAKNGRASASHLLRRAVSIAETPDTLAAYARGALALYDMEMLQEALLRIDQASEKDDALRALVDNIHAGPLRAVALARRLTRKQPLAIEPVGGRVLYVLHKSLPYASDGYATRSHNLAKALLCIGIDLVCLTRPGFPFDLYPSDDSGQDIPPVETVDGVPYHHLATPTRRAYPGRPSDHMAHASLDYLEQAANSIVEEIRQHRPAVVMAGSNHVTALPACLAAHMTGLPFVYEVRGFWELTHASRDPAYPLTIAGRQERFIEISTACAAEAVLTLTPPMRQELITRGVAPDRIGIVPNASDPEEFIPLPRDPELVRQINLPREVPVIGYVGSFTQYEGLDDLVRACAILRDQGRVFRLVLVGSEPPIPTGAPSVTDRIQATASETGLADWLIMPGRVPHSQTRNWYSLLDIAPFPRKSQPVTELVSPLKPFEAMAMEKAVVVSSVGGMQGIVEDGKTGLIFAKDDISALARALDCLLGDHELCTQLGKAGRSWILNTRNWRQTAQSMQFHLAALSEMSARP